MFQSIRVAAAGLLLSMAAPLAFNVAHAETPAATDGVTVIHLDEYNGYFAAKETLASLKPGKYRLVVTNKADKMVGFQVQDGVSHKVLDMFPLEPGQSRNSDIEVGENGFRYRCPINPTPWYDVSVGG